MDKLKLILEQEKSKYPELFCHVNFEKRLKWELIEVDVQDAEEYFINLYNLKAKFENNENNLLIAKLLGLVEAVDLDKEPATKMGEFPDVDVDYLPIVRDYLKNVWAPKEFGENQVCNIGNYGTFGIKSTLIDMARVHGLDRGEIIGITKKIGLKDDDGQALTFDKALEMHSLLKDYCDRYPDVAIATKKLLHRNRSMGKHAGGLIICNDRIDNFVPLVRGADGAPVSAWVEGLHGQDLGPVGLIKFDLLVVSGLYQIALASNLVKERHNIDKISAVEGGWDWSDISYLNDSKSIEMANRGDMKCIFQYDSDGIRSLVRKGGVDSFEDLIAYVSIFRPGTLSVKMDEAYCRRKHGTEEFEIHDLIKTIVGSTYGVLIYQEQIMMILNVVGKIPLRDCYQVIKAISKKKLHTFIKYKNQFIMNGQIILKKTQKEMEDYWSQIESFSGYGFNKSLTDDTIIYGVDGSKKIKDIIAGDKVYCINEKGEQAQTEVVAVHDHGTIDVAEVTFDDGYSVKCTFDHKFLTEEGQVPLWKIIRYNLVVLSSPLGEQSDKNHTFLASRTSVRQDLFSQKSRGNEERVLDYAPITDTLHLTHRRVLGVVSVGKRQCYDLEVTASTHNFILPNGIITGNSHATAYSYISARQLYLKSHYPLEFFASTLMNEDGDDKKREYITEAINHDIKVMPLDINKSKSNFSIIDDKIYIGFSNIKGIGEEKASKIVEMQPYLSFENFLEKFGIDATVLRALIPLGVFTDASPEILYKFWIRYSEYQKSIKEKQKRFQINVENIIKDLIEVLPEQMHKISYLNDKVFDVIRDYLPINKCKNLEEVLSCVGLLEKKFLALKQRFQNIISKAELEKPVLINFDSSKVEIEDGKVLSVLKNVELGEETYYGFIWNSCVRACEHYVPNKNFENIKIKSLHSAQKVFLVICEIKEVDVRKFRNGNGMYASVEVIDDNFEKAAITFWEDDYLRFKPELQKGNLLSVQVVPSTSGYPGYTFNSPPRHLRHEIPKDKSRDYRLILHEK